MTGEASFQAFSAQHKPRLDHRLQAILKAEQAPARVTDYSQAYTSLLTELAKLLGRGGKRLRPLLCILAYEAYGGLQPATILELAAAQELVHCFLLIHDDIIDHDCQRWGGPNISGVYFERFSASMPPRDALHMAQSWALLGGDICLTLANQTMQASDLPPATTSAVQQLTQQVILEVIAGELSDCAASLPTAQPSVAATLAMYSRKTASYSFRLPLQTGALAAGAAAAECAYLAQLAEHLGIAFQLHDDVLGIFGEIAKTGKSNLSDLREGKRTLLVISALERATPAVRQQLQKLLGQTDAGPAELAQAQDIIRTSGALSYVQALAAGQLAQASALLALSAMDTVGQTRLQELLGQLADRQS